MFKKLGIIEQWGFGLKIITDEMKLYPDVNIKWEEHGMSFRIIFEKTFTEQIEMNDNEDSRPKNDNNRSDATDYERLRTIMNDYLMKRKKSYYIY